MDCGKEHIACICEKIWYSITLGEKKENRVPIFYINDQKRKRGEKMEMDTIAAISTPMGEGAISIVRLSGENAIAIANRLFAGVGGKKLADVPSHTIHYGKIVDPDT